MKSKFSKILSAIIGLNLMFASMTPDVVNAANFIEKPNGDYSMAVTMLDVGQGLSMLIESDGEYMLYDGGGKAYSSYVVSYLKKHEIDNLKYMITSHYDEDHISGLVGVLNTTKIDTVIRPDYEHDSKTYDSYIDKLSQNGAATVFPDVGEKFTLGSATIEVLSPEEYNHEPNDNSIVVNINDNDFNCVITGDATSEMEESMVEKNILSDCDLYVVGHHGSAYSSSSTFLHEIKPEFSFVSVGEGNSYGHPTEKAMENLKEINSQVFRTDIQGEVRCYSNGVDYWFDKTPCNDYTPGDDAQISDTEYVENTDLQISGNMNGSYILNTSTRKIHLPSCRYAKSINVSNKKESNESLEKLISQGYIPCKVCSP